ncbi:endonuclease/exonuclease/phosphatase family protein [Microbacterium sp. W1N]|uniref:endonuclease/exonuclease/phosphatase family protein n=1 Tax=Microbacterium festucae TaxID=2977531 RepID=UPI0021BE2564|nr:endonuclease/exonuclease/phosphatase family protein [Microbacterium festucae]MCT9820510.1 endonuclease/exonuclease/phosphatase family protein [Microbacterium festucae]
MSALVGAVPPPHLHVMTFNVRRPLPVTARPADRWRRREPALLRLLATERPSLLAAQEVLPLPARAIAAALGPGYRRIGHGRQPGPRGEGTPLFYDSARLELLEGAQWALSDHPDRPGSTGWGSPTPRVAVEAVLRDRATGAVFLTIGTHLDVFSVRARRLSAAAIGARVAARALPTIVLGDMNAGPHSAPLSILTASGLGDAWLVAERHLTPEWGTLAGYRTPRAHGRRIDAVLVSGDIGVARIGIHGTPTDGVWPSDHLPVQAVLRLPGGRV